MKKKKGQKPKSNISSRKTIRKQKRLEKKVVRHKHYIEKSKRNAEVGRYVKNLSHTGLKDDDLDQKPQQKERAKKQQPTALDKTIADVKRDHEKQKKLQNDMDKKRKEMLLKANDEEDKMIKKLEKQLGLKKVKNVSKFFEGDGLDYLLEVCDSSTKDKLIAAEQHLANIENESDFEDDLAEVTGKKQKVEPGESSDEDFLESDMGSMEGSMEGELDEMDDEDFDDITKDIDRKDISKGKKKQSQTKPPRENEDESVSELSGDEMDSGSDSIDSDNEKGKEKDGTWEDIYGRKRDKDGSLIKEEKNAYVPPHLRNKELSDDDKNNVQLTREIKSVLNKLAESNMHWACTSIESLYSKNSRNAVNTILSKLWMAATIQPVLTPERLVIEHTALLAVLHANVGMEVGAHFLQVLVQNLDQLLRTDLPLENKELENSVSCLAYFYSFKIYDSSLLYEIMKQLLHELSEKRVDCVVIALRCAGATLRKSDANAFKTFLQEVNGQMALMNEQAQGSRAKFLMEVLTAVKNNNLTKIPNYDPTYSEHIKKLIKNVIRRGNTVTSLNIGYDDLLKVEERGKWWVVGSAWEGSQTLEKKTQDKSGIESKYEKKLLDLARKQRMNTEIRRSIFCIIMSAEDYMDAFEKLQHLGLKGQQDREIIHVLLACCLQEANYNPYYGVLAQKLCDTDRKYQLSIQYCCWDKMKEMDSLSKIQMANLSKFLVHLVMEKGLPLSVLKVIEFSDLNKSTVKFMRQTLLSIIMNADLESSLEVFRRISIAPKLRMFRESLKLFIHHFLLKNAGKKNKLLSDHEMEILTDRVLLVEKILQQNENKVVL